MIEGYRMAIFVSEMEIEMNMKRVNDAIVRHDNLKKEYKDLNDSAPIDPLSMFKETPSEKDLADMAKKLDDERTEKLKTLESNIKVADSEIKMAEGELARIQGIALKNREKFDFAVSYKIKKSYADGK